MDKWILPTIISIILISIFWPSFLIFIASLLGIWFGIVGYFHYKTPPPYLSVTANLDIVLNWFSKANRKYIVIIRDEVNIERRLSEDKSTKNEYTGSYSINSLVITNLEPNKKYYYEIVREDNPKKYLARGKNYFFIKPTEDFQSNSLTVGVFGDIQPQNGVPPLIQMLVVRKIRKHNPELVLFLGDHTNEGIFTAGWVIFYHLIGKIARNTPILGVPGNHDTKLKRTDGPRFIEPAYKTFVNYPDPKDRYFITINGLQIFAFDFSSGFSAESKNFKLFTTNVGQLKCEYWPIIMWHSSPYNSLRVDESKEYIRDQIIPVLDEKGCHLWLGGHEHSYQRYRVGDTYYITAGATSSFHKHWYSSDFQEKLIMKYHYVILNVDPNRIKLRAISTFNKILDEILIKK